MATEIQGAARHQPDQDLWRGEVSRYSSSSGIHPPTTGLYQGEQLGTGPDLQS